MIHLTRFPTSLQEVRQANAAMPTSGARTESCERNMHHASTGKSWAGWGKCLRTSHQNLDSARLAVHTRGARLRITSLGCGWQSLQNSLCSGDSRPVVTSTSKHIPFTTAKFKKSNSNRFQKVSRLETSQRKARACVYPPCKMHNVWSTWASNALQSYWHRLGKPSSPAQRKH